MPLPIRTKVIGIISAIIAGMTAASVIAGISLTSRNLVETIENDMGVSGVIAEQLIAEKVARLRTDMRLVAEKCRALDDERVKKVLREEAVNLGYLTIGLIGGDGRMLAYGVKPPDPKIVETENARRAARGEVVMSTTQFNNYGDFIMRFWIPLEDGRLLVASLPGTVISDMLSRFRIWETGNIFVLDHQGVMIANPNPRLVFERVNYIQAAETEEQYRPMAGVFSSMVKGNTGTGEYSYGGAKWICAYRPIQGTDGWSLGVACPVIESPISHVVRSFLVSGAVFLGLGLMVTFFAAGFISRPFEKIEELALAAKSASEAKSHFLANMSHEMRTPLNAIIGFSEMELGKERKGEAQTLYSEGTRESLEKIYGSGMTLLGLINDILDISKIESGRFELVPVNYDMPSLLNDTVVLNIVRIGSKPIVFKLDIDENLPARLFGDELRIKQILNNLLSNAFKYTKEGTVILRIRCERDGPGVWMNASVSDTGIGIREEDKGKVFGEYNQLNALSNRHIEGTGLGLAITRRIAEMMSGTITMESEYGRGSTFTVRLLQGFAGEAVIGKALADKLKEFRYTMARHDRNKQLVRSFIPYARVLVVDDVVTNLDLARGIMAPYGMTVDCVTDGKTAIDLIRKGEPRYTVIFMDHMMPGMDGIEAARIIRNEIGTEYARTIPIIALTANAIIGNEELFFNNGFQDFLTKPIDIMKLNETINRWVRDKKMEKEMGLDKGSLMAGEKQEEDVEMLYGPEETDMLLHFTDSIRSNPVEGLNVKKGIDRFGGDRIAYLDCLRSYAAHTPSLLSAVKTIGAPADYAITVHGVKGSSYGIAADTIGQKAEELEHAARAGNLAFIEAENGGFVDALEKFIGGLTRIIDGLEQKRKRPLKPAPDTALLAKIRAAAENYDMGELDRVMGELEQYNYESNTDLVLWLRAQIDKCGFEEITEWLMPPERENILLFETGYRLEEGADYERPTADSFLG
ncbi:MAG: response regulator [Treponema sp.]|jgi:signal transduction histidine kinase/FixJ family two-component response regulator|nr:response regulator [Treponema sp.]